METQIPSTSDQLQLAVIQRKLFLDNRVRNGANWLFWIAGLSLLNTVIYLSGNKLTFVIGLAATQFIDGFMTGVVRHYGNGLGFLHIVGFIIDLCITGMFAILGYFGRKRNRWPFIIGMILYFADGIVMLLFQDWIGVLFHFIALSGIWNGFRSLGELGVLEKSSATESIEILRQRIPSLNLQSPSQQKIIRWVFVGLILLILVPFFLFLFWLFQYQH